MELTEPDKVTIIKVMMGNAGVVAEIMANIDQGTAIITGIEVPMMHQETTFSRQSGSSEEGVMQIIGIGENSSVEVVVVATITGTITVKEVTGEATTVTTDREIAADISE